MCIRDSLSHHGCVLRGGAFPSGAYQRRVGEGSHSEAPDRGRARTAEVLPHRSLELPAFVRVCLLYTSSRIESGQMELQERRFDIDDVVGGVEAIIRPQAQAKSQELRLSLIHISGNVVPGIHQRGG